jgi:hypothetical protein
MFLMLPLQHREHAGMAIKRLRRYAAVEPSHKNVRRLAILITLDTVDGPPIP